uniref:Uncharacterized protein n=1 Tax=Caenorhabditis japonica TaxID=281687 RepID=A0A8R1ILM2_CAEJA
MDKRYKLAEETFVMVVGPERDKPLFKFMLSRCYIRNKKPQKAWDIMTKSENTNDRLNLLKLIAHDCYIATEYYFSTKAFHEIEKLDPSPENWNGKRGACAGLFRQLTTQKNDQVLVHQMREVLQLIDSNHHPNCEFLLKVIRSWGESHNVPLTI